jgi:hypothetical protein
MRKEQQLAETAGEEWGVAAVSGCWSRPNHAPVQTLWNAARERRMINWREYSMN